MRRGGLAIYRLENEVLREVGMLSRCIQSISDIKFREIHLQRGQFTFLTRICENQGINLVDLSNLLKVDKATTTKAVQKLIAENYVTRRREDGDQRMWHLFPTVKASEIYPYIIEEENGNIANCFQGFTETEQDSILQLVRRMRENIEQEWKVLKTTKEGSGKMMIQQYEEGYKEEIIDLILTIQQQEFQIPISRKDQPDLETISDFYQSGRGNFWIALENGKVVGTISLLDIGGGLGALRKLFVHPDYRGGKYKTAKRLLDELFQWARKQNFTDIYLGTTAKFLAAHRFYEKNKFALIAPEDLPKSFPIMKVDTRFYHYTLADDHSVGAQ